MKPIYGFTGTPESFGSPPDAPADTPAELAEVEENAKRAELSVGLPDSFVTAADGRQSEGVAVTTTSVDFGGSSGGFDFSMFLVSAGVPDWVMIARGQVTLVSPDGRRSIVRELQDDPAVWTNAASEIQAGRLLFKQPLPASFTPADVDRVIVEAAEDRYSWMLTVRNRSDKGVRQALIDVVVFFRRAFGRQDERVYFVAQSFSSVQAFNRRKKELKEYFVAFNQAADPRPEIDEGDWMFDPVNFRWHKIGQVLEEGALTAAEITALSVPAGVPAPDTKITFRLEGADVAGEVIERGIFMQGVVDVYPIEPKASE